MPGRNGFEAQILADLRRTHAQLKVNAERPNLDGSKNVRSWSMRLTLEEVETLLAMADECIELRRQTVGDWEPDFPPVRVTPVDVLAERVQVDGPAIPESIARMMDEKIRDVVQTVTSPGFFQGKPVGGDPSFGQKITLTPEPGSVLDVAARTGVNIGREGCPRRGTIHSCPVGGCPDDSPRETAIPDLPGCDHAAWEEIGGGARRCADCKTHLGREERETPPTTSAPLPLEPCLSTASHAAHRWHVHRHGSDRRDAVICPGFRPGDEMPIA